MSDGTGYGEQASRVRVRLEGWDVDALDWRRVLVNSSGELIATLDAGAVTVGTVNQGTGGSSAWKVDGSAVTQPVSGTFWQVTQPVSGPLTDTQLRATPVPVSGTVAVTQSTSPWVTNDPGLPDTLGQKTMAGSTGVVLASDQASIPVAATLTAETTKVIGTVNQGTSPWVVSGGANVFHVDDNSGTLTVDAPVATPVFARLSDGAAALIGQKAMALSLPVALASDQASIPVAASLASVPSHDVTNAGTFAVQATLGAETTKVIGSGPQDDAMLLELRKQTAQLGLLLSQFNVNEFDLEGAV